MLNFYAQLNIAENAEQEEIKKSYRDLAKQSHPDINPGSEEQFRKITHAYKVLSNPEARIDYDKTLRSYRSKTSSISDYEQTSYTVERKHLKTVLRELINHGHFTSITVKHRQKKLFTLSFPVAAALGMVGIVKAPLTFLLLQLGIGAMFTIEVTNQVISLYNEANENYMNGKIIQAESIYKIILKKSAYFIPARINLGLLYRQRGESKKAIKCFKQVLDIVPYGEIGELARNNLRELRGF